MVFFNIGFGFGENMNWESNNKTLIANISNILVLGKKVLILLHVKTI